MWCSEHETGVRSGAVTRRRPLGEAMVQGCRTWKPRALMAAMGTSRAALDTLVAARLGRWVGNDLLIFGFDLYGQNAYAKIRNRHDAKEAAGEEPAQATGQSSTQGAGEEPAQAAGETPAQAAGETPAQGRAEQSRAELIHEGKGPAGTGGGPAPDDDYAGEDCVVGDVEVEDYEEHLAPVTSIDSARMHQPAPAPQPSPILGTLAEVLLFRTGTTATSADRQALVGFYSELPQQDADAALSRLKRYWQEERTPTVGAFLDSERRSRPGLRGVR